MWSCFFNVVCIQASPIAWILPAYTGVSSLVFKNCIKSGVVIVLGIDDVETCSFVMDLWDYGGNTDDSETSSNSSGTVYNTSTRIIYIYVCLSVCVCVCVCGLFGVG